MSNGVVITFAIERKSLERWDRVFPADANFRSGEFIFEEDARTALSRLRGDDPDEYRAVRIDRVMKVAESTAVLLEELPEPQLVEGARIAPLTAPVERPYAGPRLQYRLIQSGASPFTGSWYVVPHDGYDGLGNVVVEFRIKPE